MMDNFALDSRYHCNLTSEGEAYPYRDDAHNAARYQIKVYDYAARCIRSNSLKSVLDIGCGYGLKLRDIIHPLCGNIVGIDRAYAIHYCQKKHGFGRWYEDDIETSKLVLDETFDLIIAVDVIEHLRNPDNLLRYIRRFCHPDSWVLLSTPDRDMISSKNTLGPPINKAHVREWNRTEFRRYLQSRRFDIFHHFLTGEAGIPLNNFIKNMMLRRPLRKCQVVLSRPLYSGNG